MKKNKKKNLNKYWDRYRKLYSFEEFSAIYREKELLNSVSFSEKNILEVGCGFRPFFLSSKKFKSYIAIEPGKDAFTAVKKLSNRKKNVKVFNTTFEQWDFSKNKIKFDLIILPGVLHEVDNAIKILKLCESYLARKGKIYINVPNANSLHRKLAVAMGINKKVSDFTYRNKKLEQNYVFTNNDLYSLVNKASKNLKVVKIRSFFLKPFTHEQMLKSVSSKIICPKIIKGLYNISDEIGDLGSELACILEFKNAK